MAENFGTGQKHCGKRRNCSLPDLYCRHVKTRACLGNGSVSARMRPCGIPANKLGFLHISKHGTPDLAL